MNIKNYLKKMVKLVKLNNLKQALRENNLNEYYDLNMKIVNNIFNQHSKYDEPNQFLEVKRRGQHAFQISFTIDIIKNLEKPIIVDIGDSSGNHILQISSKKSIGDSLSLNIDPNAIKKIKSIGLKAELLDAQNPKIDEIKADVFLSFEMFEHLHNPTQFLKNISYSKHDFRYLILTIPYVRKSRVGLKYVRNNSTEIHDGEDTHIFELSPMDFEILARHAGLRVVKQKIYYQYPRKSVLKYIYQLIWKKYDFEGFVAFAMVKDHSLSNNYKWS